VVLMHGFPECWLAWRYQLPALAAAGFRAVAPDLRGYGGSDKPGGAAAYRIELLARDSAELVVALGRERADLVGHDWGAHIAWHVAMWDPRRVRRLAILNVPHPERMRRGLRTLRQLRKSWYMLFFQLPVLPEWFMSPRRLRRAFRYTPACRGAYDDAVIEAMVAAAGDRTAPINYYRAAARYRRPSWKPVPAETQVIWGRRAQWPGGELAEPAPGKTAPHTEPTFVVHKHDATRLHYDVRLEIDGALASWSVPKGPSYDPAVKRLAIQTEDHPLEYGSFEGRIPDGEYGAGDSLIWDNGTCDSVPSGQLSQQRKKGHVVVEFHGKKLRGQWHLVRTHGGAPGKAQWLMFKAKDGTENPSYDVIAERPESVVSGRVITRGPERSGKLRT